MEKRESVVVEQNGRKVYESYMGLKGFDFLKIQMNAMVVNGFTTATEESLKGLTLKDYKGFFLHEGEYYGDPIPLYEASTLWELLMLLSQSGYNGNGYICGVYHDGDSVCVGSADNGKFYFTIPEYYGGDLNTAWGIFWNHQKYQSGHYELKFPVETLAYVQEMTEAFSDNRSVLSDSGVPGLLGEFYLK